MNENRSFALLRLVAAMGAATLMLNGCGKEPASTRVDLLAEVGGHGITEETFRYWWSKAPPSEDTPAARRALLDKLVDRALRVEKARAAGLDRDPVVVEAFESFLIARLHELQLEPALAAVEVSEEEMRAYYESARERENSPFHVPPSARVAVLWYDTRGQAPLADRYRLRLEQARAGLTSATHSGTHELSFGGLSITHSEHRPSRYKGGEIGWIELDSPHTDPWRNAVAQIAVTLEHPGELSPVMVRDEGVFLVRLMETVPERIRDFAEVRERIHKYLLHEKQSDLRASFEQALTNGNLVRIESDRLEGMTGLEARPAESASQRFNTTLITPQQP